MLLLYKSLVFFLSIHSLFASILPQEIRSYQHPHLVEDIIGSTEQVRYNSKRQMASFSITGVQSGRGGDGSVPLRLEIRQLQQNADQWNLYLLALDRLQNVNQTELLSWYQISGIHGRPFVSWDNVQATSGDDQSGYCTHSSILFPTWHRPYLALYEQVLYSLMQQIVGEFSAGSDRDRYTTAASNFRIPYWDWAAAPPSGQSVLPSSVAGSATVQVTTPKGTTTIKNPLYSYTFHPLDPKELPDSPFSTWPSTLRYPTSASDPAATSQNDLVAQQLDNNRLSFRNRLYNLFTSYPNYTNFSNKAWIPAAGGGNYDSIESVHDQIHGLVGSGGHMSIIDYSAFDPIFYLHHVNVDRAFAIWQALYPDSYVQPETTQWGTFTNSPGQTEDVNTALTPFHSDGSGDFWNSGTARNTSTFGYSYPELLYWKASGQQYQANVRAAVNSLYSSSAPATNVRRSGKHENLPQGIKPRAMATGGFDGPSDEKPSIVVREQAVDPNHQYSSSSSTSKDGKYREWIANIRVKKYALDNSFFIHIFLGDFNPNPFKWSFEPNLVGTQCIFVNNPHTTRCSKCKRDQANDLQVTGAIPLTTALIAAVHAGSLTSLDPADVEPYLKSNLHWRVTRMDDTAVPIAQVPDLKIAVVSSVVQKAASDTEFPQWGDFNVHDNVTDSRPAGLNSGEYV